MHQAELVELRDSEEQFYADLAEILSPENIAEGVHIDFGADRERLAEVLEQLAVMKQVKLGNAHIQQLAVRHGMSTNYIGGTEAASMQELGPIDCLDVMQSTEWQVARPTLSGLSPHIIADQSLTSTILFCSTDIDEKTDEKMANFGTTGIVIGAEYAYQPAIDEDVFGGIESVAHVFEPMADRRHEWGARPGKSLAMFMLNEGHGLYMPSANYFLRIGEFRSPGTPFGVSADVHTTIVARADERRRLAIVPEQAIE